MELILNKFGKTITDKTDFIKEGSSPCWVLFYKEKFKSSHSSLFAAYNNEFVATDHITHIQIHSHNSGFWDAKG